jgi:hypothetical protein
MRVMSIGLVLMIVATCSSGCKTSGQTGALAGTGIGALAGQAIGGNTTATLIGAGVGAGVGYIIGNEVDKKHAREMTGTPPPAAPTHTEVNPLGGTRWLLISLNPSNFAPPYRSKTVDFRTNGRVITSTVKPDGRVEIFDEGYRVVGDTLIVNKPNYLINARYTIAGNQLIVNAQQFSAVLQRQ